MGKEGLVYIEPSLMKAQLLLLFLSQKQQFLRQQQQQGQLHMHSLACKTRKSIIYSSQKMVKFSNKKEGHSRSLARREGSSEEVMAQMWEENYPVLITVLLRSSCPKVGHLILPACWDARRPRGDGAMQSPFFL